MKKISLILFTCLVALSLSAAADRQPVVTLNTGNDYEVKIDHTTYNGNHTISNLSQGSHTVEVYQVKKGFLGKRRTLVSSSNFEVRNNDIRISVDNNGQLRINGSGGSMERKNRERNSDRNRNNDRDDDDDDDDDKKWKKNKKEKHSNGHNNGRGKKKGHTKHHDDNDD